MKLNDYQTIAAFSKENETEISFCEYAISGEIRKGECGEIMEKEEMRSRFEDAIEDGEIIENMDGEPYASFEEYFDDVTDMGGYFWQVLPAYYIVLLDRMVLENDDCSTWKFDDLDECLEEALDAAERCSKYDPIKGEWKQPSITIECYRASR